MPDICPRTGQKHVPSWRTVWDDGDDHLLVQCIECYQWGTVGEIKALEETITWEE